VRGERRRDPLDELDLLVSKQTSALDQNDSGMQLAGGRQLFKVVNVRRHQHSILLVGALQEFFIRGPEDSSIAHMIRVDSIRDQRYSRRLEARARPRSAGGKSDLEGSARGRSSTNRRSLARAHGPLRQDSDRADRTLREPHAAGLDTVRELRRSRRSTRSTAR
jgi:hypothetical protein